MADADHLKAAFERLIGGTASEADRNALRAAFANGVLVTGEGAVAIGGDASDVIITTGGGNIVLSLKGADAATMREALSSIAPTRLHQVPPPPADFTGRKDELEELLATIEQGGVTISGLQGLGGIGKTVLALKLVEQLKPSYPDAQFYLDLKGASSKPLTVNEALAHVIRAYHPAAKLPDSQTELQNLYLSVLDGKRALLLMDNAASAEQVEPLIPPAGCVLLVTSRWHFTLPGLATKNLDTLTAADARAFLLAIAPRIGEWAEEIAKLCGYLPLALRLAAGALAKYRNVEPEYYAQRLQDAPQRLQLIEASLSLSYELLSEELRERWRWLAVFPDTFAECSAAAVWTIEQDQAQEALGELIAASMVEWNETTGRYRLHDLARLFADAKLSAAERVSGQKNHATHYTDILAVANALYSQGREEVVYGLAVLDLEWGNIQAGHVWVAAQDLDVNEDMAQLCIAYPDAGYLVLDLRQHPRERVRWLELALVAARRLKDRANEGHALGNLGLAYRSLGESQRSIQFHEQALKIARELGNRSSESYALGNLGSCYIERGERQRAIQFYEQQLTIAREVGNRRSEHHALNNLGNAYAAQGETKLAIKFLKKCLVIAREIGDPRGESLALGNLGVAYGDLGKIPRAIKFYERALLIDRELADRKSEGIDLWNMSLELYRFGKRAQAIQHAEQSLAILELIENPGAAKVRGILAEWRDELGQEQASPDRVGK